MYLEQTYNKLRKFMDYLPTGFPETESGVEISILKKLFTPEQAELFMKLKNEPESIDEISNRTGMEVSILKPKIENMAQKGLLFRTRDKEKVQYQTYHLAHHFFQRQNIQLSFLNTGASRAGRATSRCPGAGQ